MVSFPASLLITVWTDAARRVRVLLGELLSFGFSLRICQCQTDGGTSEGANVGCFAENSVSDDAPVLMGAVGGIVFGHDEDEPPFQ
ncbi:hypothetical protein CQ019_04120 [Arthrobacter sp. MYb229]|nr:hypothetical protein CQ019_04120 [Arthrobacter sp. MYb229]PRB53474.1 hypothetical protein CQ013_04120 [Arthrobacter sp. MYb216]